MQVQGRSGEGERERGGGGEGGAHNPPQTSVILLFHIKATLLLHA